MWNDNNNDVSLEWSVPAHITVHTVVLRPLLDIVAVHAVVLSLAGLQLDVLQLVDAVVLAVRVHLLLDVVTLLLDQQPRVPVLRLVLLHDHRLRETLRLRVIVD